MIMKTTGLAWSIIWVGALLGSAPAFSADSGDEFVVGPNYTNAPELTIRAELCTYSR